MLEGGRIKIGGYMKIKCILLGHDKSPELRTDNGRKIDNKKKYHYRYCKDCGKKFYE
jgi:hypothetical protein